MNRIQSISHKEIGKISKEKMMEIGSEINKKLLLSFNLLSLKRDDPLRIDSKLISNLFPVSAEHDSIVSNFFETHRHIILNKQDSVSSSELHKQQFTKKGLKIKENEFGWFAVEPSDSN